MNRYEIVISSLDIPLDVSRLIYKYDYFLSGKLELEIPSPQYIENIIQLSKDLIIIGEKYPGALKTLKIYNLKTFEYTYINVGGNIYDLRILSENKIVIILFHKLMIYDVKTKESKSFACSKSIPSFDTYKEYLAFSSFDSKLIKIRNIETSIYKSIELPFDVSCILLISEKKMITGHSNGYILIWDLDTETYITLQDLSFEITALKLLPHNCLLGKSLHSEIIWNLDTLKSKCRIKSSKFNTLINDHQIIIEINSIFIYDFLTSGVVLLNKNGKNINYICVLPNGQIACSMNDCTVEIWDIESQRFISAFACDSNFMMILKDNRLITGSYDKIEVFS